MFCVVFAGTFAASLEPLVRTHVKTPCQVQVSDERDVIARLPEADALVTMAFSPAMGAVATRLKLIQVPGAGLDRIDRSAVPAWTALANVYGHETGIAEYVLGAILALTREFVRLDGALRRGIWESQWAPGVPPPPVWPELAGKTLGIVGHGRIGQSLARRARAFDMTVLGIRRDTTRSDPNATVCGPDALEEVLARADALAITAPLTAETRGLLGERELSAMKPTAVLVNVSRAEIVDEDALYVALAERRIAAAALDVWYRYPTSAGPTWPAHRAFHELPNVLMTPHVSGWTEGMLQARASLIAANIDRVARGEPPLNLIPSS